MHLLHLLQKSHFKLSGVFFICFPQSLQYTFMWTTPHEVYFTDIGLKGILSGKQTYYENMNHDKYNICFCLFCYLTKHLQGFLPEISRCAVGLLPL